MTIKTQTLLMVTVLLVVADGMSWPVAVELLELPERPGVMSWTLPADASKITDSGSRLA